MGDWHDIGGGHQGKEPLVSVPNEDIGQLALCAFWYSLMCFDGVPREICERILRVADQVPQSWREQIAKEAVEALALRGVPDTGDKAALSGVVELWSVRHG